MIIEQRVEIFFLVIIFNLIPTIIHSTPEPDYYRYLQKYGYTPKVEGRRLFSVVAKSSYAEGIMKLQRLYKLPETGELDEKTKTFMQKARCGNPDLGTYDSISHPVNVDKPESLATNVQGRSAKAKASEASKTHTYSWPKKQLKWYIEEYPKLQQHIKTNADILKIMNEAFNDWQKHSGLKFEMARKKEEADIKIKFRSNDHGDGYPFDGPGATLAHAFYPTSGDIHFDDDESFTNNYTSNHALYILRLVAAHEIGHALGLTHSFEEGSLMYPVYQQFNESFELTSVDQRDIQAIYGKPELKSATEVPKTTASSKVTTTTTYVPDLLPTDNWCPGEFQTGCEGPDGELYLFKDDQVWRYQARKKRSWDPRPKLISESFRTLPDTTITACVRSSLGYTYLFRNYRMWKLITHWSSEGPHTLRGKNYPQNPRVALLHQNSIYLIRNRLIYRLNEFDYDGDLEISTIDSILHPPPDGFIQSGFTYDKRHYIFTRRYIYVYDSTHGTLLPGYPKYITNGWFACDSTSKAPQWKKKSTSTKPSRTYGHDEDEDDSHFDHHHHHHHPHHRPRRPFHRPPPVGPHEYRRRWDD